MSRQTRCHLLAATILAGLLVAPAADAASQVRASRLSGAVAFARETPAARNFLAKPKIGFVQAYVRFGPDLADDVIMFVDQELLEGLAKPRWVSGGDWMALVGVQRNGRVWIAGGTEQTAMGIPSTARAWVFRNLEQPLKHNIWYRLRVEADFANRRFLNFSIRGGGLDQTFDLLTVPLDYPNYMPLAHAGMIYVVGAMRSRDLMQRVGTSLVYFDDVAGGLIRPDGSSQRLFSSDFDAQSRISNQPVVTNPIRLDNYTLGRWYLEREEAIFKIRSAPFARSRGRVGVADAKLDD